MRASSAISGFNIYELESFFFSFRTSFGFVYGHDIAMLHLNVPAIRTLWIREVCLPPPNLEPITGEFVVVTGWGQLDRKKNLHIEIFNRL